MYISDYHTHSNFSFDSHSTMEEMVKAAICNGINEYCFTDHLDTFDPNANLLDIFKSNEYQLEFNMLKEKYKNTINLKLGIEFGLEPSIEEKFYSFSQNLPFDFIIGSTHNANFQDLISGGHFIKKYNQNEFYTFYLERLYKAAQMHKCFDVMGHFDYVTRYVPYKDKFIDFNLHKDIIDSILTILIENGKGIEINTSGLRYGLTYVHPNMDILKRYKELGGEIITIGSDAHRPESIFEYYKNGVIAATEAGFKYYTRFDQRKPIFEKFD